MAKKKLGEILIEAGAIDEYQLKSALGYQKRWGGRLGKVLVENHFISEDTLVQAIHNQAGIPVVNVNRLQIPDYLLQLIPVDIAEKHNLVPVKLDGTPGKPGEILVVAMADPTDLSAIDEVQFKTGKRTKAVLAGENQIAKAIRAHYHGERDEELNLDMGPEDIQFSGPELVAEDMMLVQGKLEGATTGSAAPATAEAPGKPPAPAALVLDDPFAELEALARGPDGPAVSPGGVFASEAEIEQAFAGVEFVARDGKDAPAQAVGANAVADPAANAFAQGTTAPASSPRLDASAAEIPDIDIEELTPLEELPADAVISPAPPAPVVNPAPKATDGVPGLMRDMEEMIASAEPAVPIRIVSSPPAQHPPSPAPPSPIPSVAFLSPTPASVSPSIPAAPLAGSSPSATQAKAHGLPRTGEPRPPVKPKDDAAHSAAMEALLSRVGLDGKRAPRKPEPSGASVSVAATTARESPKPKPEERVEKKPEPGAPGQLASSTAPAAEGKERSLAPDEMKLLEQIEGGTLDANPPQVLKPGHLVAAVIRLLMRKGLISEVELLDELKRH